MDYGFFNGLSSQDAKKFLQNFLSEAGEGFGAMKSDMEADGITVDHSISSLVSVFEWLAEKLETLPEKEDKSLPVWIRETESYKKGLYAFTATSSILILRYAFYLGDCFVRQYSQLRWETGSPRTAVKHQPVVAGFTSKREMSTMLISENLFSRNIEDNDAGIGNALTYWVGCVPDAV